MRTSHFLTSAAVIFFSFFSVKTFAQTAIIKGVVVEEFQVKEGKIKVFLPDDARVGVKISGTVMTEATGRNEKEKNRNNELLQKYVLTVQGTFSGEEALSRLFIISFVNPNPSITLLTADKKIVSTNSIPLKNNVSPATSITIPTHALTGSPLRITGPFDGDASNTRCSIDGKVTELIAESPGQMICNMPAAASGPHSITIEENGKTTQQEICAVNMDMTADKTNLRRGQKAIITTTISGLQKLPANVALTISNASANTVTLIGGNTQIITITPTQVNAEGTYSQTFTAQSISTGNFTINANLHLPEKGEERNNTSGTHPASLCNCYINQQSYLIPPQTCITLGGTLNPSPANNNQTNQPGPGSTSPPIVSFSQPGEMNKQSGQILLQLTAPANDVAAVIFSERPVSGSAWNPVGYALNTGNNWQCNWTTPLGNDGEHIIRARIAGKNNTVTERFSQTLLQVTPYAINPAPGERMNLTVSNKQIQDADQKTKQITDSLRLLQEKLDALQKKYDELRSKQTENTNMANELAAIDKLIDQVPGLYSDSLKALIDSLNKLKANLPAKVDPAALQKAADDAAQRVKDCQDRLNKLKEEKEQAQKNLDALNKQIEDLLDKKDALHLGNNWIGGHGYHADGSFWYGYVGDENSNTNITAEANALSNQLRALKGPHAKANKRSKNLDAEIKASEEECNKLKKEQEKAEKAAKDGNQHAAVETQVDELTRQIESLMAALQKWCDAHPGVCNFDPALSGQPGTPEELQAYLNKIDDIIEKKKKKEEELKKEEEANGAAADATGNDINNAEGDKKNLEAEKVKAQAEADQLRAQREKELEEARAAQRKKQQEEEIKKNTPKSAPTLPQPIDPSDKQIKFQAISMLRGLYRDYLINNGPCDCITKAIALANNSNTAAQDVLGGLAVGVAFAPLEAFPGLSFAAKLGLGAVKAIGSALYGGESFTDELAKNLFNVIGGEIFPKLLDSEIAGNAANTFAGKGLEEIMKAEGIRSTQWEGETELKGCGKVKGKTTMLFNPNTGWVTLLIKIDNCPLIVVKYKVNKDGVPITKPTAEKVNG